MTEADLIQNLIIWCEKEHESQANALELYESGKMRSFINQGRGELDTTQESIQEARADVVALAGNLSFLTAELRAIQPRPWGQLG